MDDSSRERCQRISNLLEDDRGFARLSTVEFLTNVGLILARVVVELVDFSLEMGRRSGLRSPHYFVIFFYRYVKLPEAALSPSTP